MPNADGTPEYLLPQMGNVPVTEPAVFRSLFILDTVEGYLGIEEDPDRIEKNIARILEERAPLIERRNICEGFMTLSQGMSTSVDAKSVAISLKERWDQQLQGWKDVPGVAEHVAPWPEIGNGTFEALVQDAHAVRDAVGNWWSELDRQIDGLNVRLKAEIVKRGDTAEVTKPLDPFAEGPPDVQRKPAVGVLTVHHQGWKQRGLARGNLLHSICLAPGEVTQVAVVDWQRRTRGASTEQTEQSETVTSDIEQARAVNEVQQAVAKEAQSGGSSTSATSITAQAGLSLGTLSFGSSVASATSATSALTAQFSTGSRNIAAESSNALTQSTAEKSQALRSRRAAVVREVSEQEREATTARVLANYNRRHALNVEYFEVLQLYEISTEMANWERCLFLPLEPIDFSKPENIDKHKATILRIFQEIGEGDRIAEFLGDRWLEGKLAAENVKKTAEEIVKKKAAIDADLAESGKSKAAAERLLKDLFVIVKVIKQYDLEPRTSERDVQRAVVWNDRRNMLPDPLKGQLKAYSSRGAAFDSQALRDAIESGRALMMRLEADVANAQAGINEQTGTLIRLTEESLKQALPAVDILQANRLALSQQIWLRMDPYRIYRMLQGKTIAGRRISTLVDPHPVGVFGNFVAFRWGFDRNPAGAQQRAEFERTYLKSAPEEQKPITVALPTAVVFAEAVLGRGEAAETIDETKFWRWDASPIPILPPKIAEIASRDRTKGLDLPPRTSPPPSLRCALRTPPTCRTWGRSWA